MISPTPPKGHNTVNPFVIVPDTKGFIDFVEKVFGGKEARHVRTPDKDGSIIHAEINVGNATIMLFDRKPDWSFTPAFLQIYVSDMENCLKKAVENGAHIVTPVSDFYGGYQLARILDPWNNLWWLYEPTAQPLPHSERYSDIDWHDREPSLVYSTLMQTLRTLQSPHST